MLKPDFPKKEKEEMKRKKKEDSRSKIERK